MIAKNREKYISFNIKVITDEHESPLGKIKLITRELQFDDSFKFMPSSLNLPAGNLVGRNGMMCKQNGTYTHWWELC